MPVWVIELIVLAAVLLLLLLRWWRRPHHHHTSGLRVQDRPWDHPYSQLGREYRSEDVHTPPEHAGPGEYEGD